MAHAEVTPSTPSTFAELLGQPEVQRLVHRVSVDRYHTLGEQGLIDEKTELIRGVVIEKMTKSPDHSWLSEFFAGWLRSRLPQGWLVRHEQPLTLADSEPEPDIAVVKGQLDDYRRRHPESAVLAIEVAVTSEKLDRQKASIYAEAGVDEYWIVLAEQQTVEAHTQPKNGRYTEVKILDTSDTLAPRAFAALELPVADLFPRDK